MERRAKALIRHGDFNYIRVFSWQIAESKDTEIPCHGRCYSMFDCFVISNLTLILPAFL